jgi:hypothetical protein
MHYAPRMPYAFLLLVFSCVEFIGGLFNASNAPELFHAEDAG